MPRATCLDPVSSSLPHHRQNQPLANLASVQHAWPSGTRRSQPRRPYGPGTFSKRQDRHQQDREHTGELVPEDWAEDVADDSDAPGSLGLPWSEGCGDPPCSFNICSYSNRAFATSNLARAALASASAKAAPASRNSNFAWLISTVEPTIRVPWRLEERPQNASALKLKCDANSLVSLS